MEAIEDNKKIIDQTLEIDGPIMNMLNETRKWAKFLSILGFIGIGIMLILGLFAGTLLNSLYDSMPAGQASKFPTFFMGFIYIILAIVYFFPVYFLYNFANKLKLALYSNDQANLYLAFSNLKRHYKFIGILAIIMLLIWGSIIIGTGLMALIAA